MPAIVLALVGWLISALRQYLPGIVGRILLTLGIGLATHTLVMPGFRAIFESYVAQLPPVLYAYFGALGLDVVATIIFSALAARQTQKVLLKRVGGAA